MHWSWWLCDNLVYGILLTVGLWKYCDSDLYDVIPLPKIFGYRGFDLNPTSLLCIWIDYRFPQSRSTSGRINRCRGTRPGVTFTQTSVKNTRNYNGNRAQPNTISGHDGHINAKVRCYSFNQCGNYASNWPDKNRGAQLIQYGIIFNK